MRNQFVTLALTLVHLAVFAQPAILEKGLKPQRGIYKTFQEFKNNAPSIKAEFQLQNTTKGHGFLNATPHETFKLLLKNPKSLSKRDSVWGVCDGEHVYISNNKVYKKRSCYDKLIYLGHFCIFETVETNYYPMMHMMPLPSGGMMPIGGGGSSRVLSTIVLNPRNGATFDLTKANLREILQNDPELLAEFESQKKKKSKLVEYLIEYCERKSKSGS